MAEDAPPYVHLDREGLNSAALSILSQITSFLDSKWVSGDGALDTVGEQDASALRPLINDLSKHCKVRAALYLEHGVLNRS